MSGKHSTELRPGDHIVAGGIPRVVKATATLSEVYRDTWEIELEPMDGQSNYAVGGLAIRWPEPDLAVRVADLEAQMRALVELVNLLGQNQSRHIGQFNDLTNLTRTMAERMIGQ